MEETDDKRFQDMKDRAKAFTNFLIDCEIEFNSELNSYGENLAQYVDFKSRNNTKISCIFHENGGTFYDIEGEKEE